MEQKNIRTFSHVSPPLVPKVLHTGVYVAYGKYGSKYESFPATASKLILSFRFFFSHLHTLVGVVFFGISGSRLTNSSPLFDKKFKFPVSPTVIPFSVVADLSSSGLFW